MASNKHKKKKTEQCLLLSIAESSINYTSHGCSIPEQYIENRESAKNVIDVSFCKWLDNLLYWQCMWIFRTHNNKNRNRIINLIGFTFSLLCLPIWFCFTVKDYKSYYFEISMSSPMSTQQDVIVSISIVLEAVFLIVARGISMYYLMVQFDFPWYHFKLKYNNRNLRKLLDSYLNIHKKELNKRLYQYVTIGFSLFIIWTTFFIIGICSEIKDGKKVYNYIPINSIKARRICATIDVLVTFFGIQCPSILFPMIWSVIALKYQFRMYYLQCLLNETDGDKTPNFVLILKEYKSFYLSFENDHKLWKCYIISYIGYYGLYLWDNIYLVRDLSRTIRFRSLDGLFQEKKMYLYVFICIGIFAYCLPLIEYTRSSSKINKEYSKFMNLLWKYDEDTSTTNDDDDDDDDDIINKIYNDSSKSQSVDILNNRYRNSLSSMQSQHLLKKYGSHRKYDYVENNQEIDFNEMSIIMFNSNKFYFLLNYVPKFQIQVKLFGIQLTWIALLKFAITGIIAYFITILQAIQF